MRAPDASLRVLDRLKKNAPTVPGLTVTAPIALCVGRLRHYRRAELLAWVEAQIRSASLCPSCALKVADRVHFGLSGAVQQEQREKRKGPESLEFQAFFRVAGAGFEPAAFGL